MAKSRGRKICQKCKKLHYCDEHHILPQGIFGGKGKTVFLCKNCHYECHRSLGFKFLRKKNKQDMAFYLKKYAVWLAGALIVGAFLVSQTSI